MGEWLEEWINGMDGWKGWIKGWTRAWVSGPRETNKWVRWNARMDGWIPHVRTPRNVTYCGLTCVGLRFQPFRVLPRPKSTSAFGTKVLVKQDQLVPVHVIRVSVVVAMARPSPVFVGQEEWQHAAGKFQRHVTQPHAVSRARRTFDHELVAKEVVVAFEGFDYEIVHWEEWLGVRLWDSPLAGMIKGSIVR